MNSIVLIFTSILYLVFLFGVAYWAEQRSVKGKSIVNNPYIYALSLAVYCTAWTFYGSVGRAVTNGIEFISVYIGPSLMMPLWWIVLRKIIRICKVQRITSIADFISSRYGKNATLGVIATIVCILGILPYIAIQLKAISNSFLIVEKASGEISSDFLLGDLALYITIVLSIFTIIFGTRTIDSTERHEGMVAAIAAEAIIKLVAFLVVGFFVSYFIFDGITDIFQQASQVSVLKNIFVFNSEQDTAGWFWHLLLSMMAIMFLPRQFQVSVIENVDEKHLNKALWLFPLYLLLINIFVIPIALGGSLIFPNHSVNPDEYVLALPLKFNQGFITLFTYLGGFSAATSMIIVETIALSVMISNNLVMPVILKSSFLQEKLAGNLSLLVKTIRRTSIVLILLMAYLYYKSIAEHYSLVSNGMVSFAAVSQFAPAIIGGIFWKNGTQKGALIGLLVGVFIWFYTLVLPSMIGAGFFPKVILEHGLFGITVLKPLALFGLEGMDSISHGLFWSLLLNIFCYVYYSINSHQSSIDYNQAVIFVDIFKYSEQVESPTIWRGTAYFSDIQLLLSNFLGEKRAEKILKLYVQKHKIRQLSDKADPQIVSYVEKILAGIIGTASARIMISSVSKEEKISTEEVISILKSSQSLLSANKELKRKSVALEKATEELKEANQILQKTDKLKDDFLSTVAHEIRTPLTSIRALSEIVYDNPAMDMTEREYFLGTVVKESERLSRLINQVLDLEKYESGKQKLILEAVDMQEIMKDSIDALYQQAKEKEIKVVFIPDRFMPRFQADKDKLVQVVVNLLSNAIKYCEPQKGEITLSTHFSEGYVYTSVTDNGTGIDKNFQRLIFDKFFQAEDQTIKKPKGSGLGLAISKKIIELHNGQIWVESQTGNGAKFTFTIPVV